MPAKKGLNQFALKAIAIVSMTIDHFAATMNTADFMLFQNAPQIYRAMRIIGRIAMPIYVFLIINGFFHTRNVKKYIVRLFGFAVITEVVFDLAFYNTWFEFRHNNVLFTFTLGVAMLAILEKYKDTKWEITKSIFTVFLFCVLAILLHVDYNMFGILAIYFFYFFHNKAEREIEKNPLAKIQNIVTANLLSFFFECLSSYGIVYLSTIPMVLYNGEQGPRLKYFFYAYYPIHLLFLYLLRLILIGGF